MATTGVVNGTDLRIYVAGKAIGYATSCTFDMTAETLETIHKDSPGTGWSESTIGNKSGSVSFEGFYNEDSTNQKPSDLFSYFDGETVLGCAFKAAGSGDTRYDFSAIITALSFTGPVEDNSTLSCTLTLTGAPTTTTVT